MALSMVASASRITGVAWTAATHTVSNPAMFPMITIFRPLAADTAFSNAGLIASKSNSSVDDDQHAS